MIDMKYAKIQIAKDENTEINLLVKLPFFTRLLGKLPIIIIIAFILYALFRK